MRAWTEVEFGKRDIRQFETTQGIPHSKGTGEDSGRTTAAKTDLRPVVTQGEKHVLPRALPPPVTTYAQVTNCAWKRRYSSSSFEPAPGVIA